MAEATGGSTPHGIYVHGAYMGFKPGRTFDRRDTGETVNVRPRLGVLVGDETVEVRCLDDAQARQYASGLSKGDDCWLPVDIRPPFGARGSVSYFLPGVFETRDDWA